MAQKPISNRIEFGQNLNPLRDYAGVPSINDDGNLQTLIDKVDKVSKFWKTGKADGDLIRYIPNILPVTRQNLITGIEPRQAYAKDTYIDKKAFEFTIKLAPNTYTNYGTMEIVLPIKFTKKSNKSASLDVNLVPVNNFFARWFTDIDIKRYPHDLRILPTDKTIEIYDYAESQLKYPPTDSLNKIKSSFLYDNSPVHLAADTDRRPNNANTEALRGDENLIWRKNNFAGRISLDHAYRIPLGLITDLGFCNFAIQTDTRFVITLERNLHKLFEDLTKRAALPTTDPDASIEFIDRPYIEYQEIILTPTWETYLKDILKEQQGVRMGVLPNPYQRTFEVAVGAQSISVDFQGASRDINWLESSLIYDKSYSHKSVYDSYGVELAAQQIESVKFDNASKAYSLTGKLSYDRNNKDEKFLLYKMFVAYVCNDATHAPLSDYKNNPIYQDMTNEYDYRATSRDDRVYIDMRRSEGNYD